MIDNFDDETEDFIGPQTLDLSKIKSNITNYTDQKLCEIVVSGRYLGFNQELSVICMEELSRRRSEGSNFDFELFIDNSLNNLPKLDFSVLNLKDILHQAIKK